jgi:GLPGLI family protein
MKKIMFALSLLFIFGYGYSQQPKIISDCTLTFSITSSASEKSDVGTKIIYIKGKDIRSDFISSKFSQSIFFNANTGKATILKTVGKSKYISYYDAEQWKTLNAEYSGVKIFFTGNTKKILDYDCKEAMLTTPGGKSYTVYYVPSLMPSVIENIFQFKDVPGLVLEYESTIKETQKITYTAIKIDFNPVPLAQFELPKEEYRILQ